MNGGTEQVSYYHTDHLGSIRAVSNTDASTMTYDAFGKLLDYAGAAQDHDYRFTGKPSDSTGLSYYGARFYDPELGKFINQDPAMDGANWYVYCYGNPLRYTDPTGLAAGDPFDSIEAAANDFGEAYSVDSIRNNREYGSTIYSYMDDGEIYYTCTVPNKGGPASVKPSLPLDGYKALAAVHTHAAYDPIYAGNVFSRGDRAYAVNKRYALYVATPNGSLKKYDPATGMITTINTKMPSDPEDPDRENEVSAYKNTIDEPYRNTRNVLYYFSITYFIKEEMRIMVIKYRPGLKVITIIFALSLCIYLGGVRAVVPTREKGYVPNEITAIRIAEAVWLPIYGKDIYKNRPFVAKLTEDKVWVVEGTLKRGWAGGVPYAEIQKEDGKILIITHSK